MLIISLIVGGLIFFGFYKWHDPENLLFSIGSAAVAFLMLATTMAVSIKGSPRSSAMMKTASGILFALMLITDVCLAGFGAGETSFIVINGIGVCLWAVIVYGIGRSKQ